MQAPEWRGWRSYRRGGCVHRQGEPVDKSAMQACNCTGWTVSIPSSRYSPRRKFPMVEAHAAPGPARDRILEAAERVVAEIGAARLTLDVVAQAAGVSKGGLLYHFPSK